MAYLADSIWVNVSTSGTADFTTTTAMAGYRTFADASTPNGSTIHYSARSATQFENGEGVYSSGTGVVTRATIYASSSAGAKVNFSGSPTLAVAPLAEDFGGSSLTIGTTTITGGTTKRVLYDLAGEVEEASHTTIYSGMPDVTEDAGAGAGYYFGTVRALYAQTSLVNWFFGLAGNFTASGADNTGIGQNALAGLTSGNRNTAMGVAALQTLSTASDCVAIGRNALAANNAADNVAIGSSALQATTSGAGNTAIGKSSLNANTDGAANIAIGSSTLVNNSHGSFNVAIGQQALSGTGDRNIGIGQYAGAAITTGNNNVIIGACSGNYGIVTSGSNNVSLGYDVGIQTDTASNQLCISNFIYGTGMNGTGATISAGKIGFGIKAPACAVDVDGEIRAKGYTIAGTLPAAGTAGRRAYVTNSAAAPVFMATLTGGGSTVVPVFDDGTNWRYG